MILCFATQFMTQGDLLVSDLIETAFLGARQNFFSTQLFFIYKAPSVKLDTLF